MDWSHGDEDLLVLGFEDAVEDEESLPIGRDWVTEEINSRFDGCHGA